MSDTEKKRLLHCNTCKVVTWHKLVASHPYLDFMDAEGEDGFEAGQSRFWVCCGCDMGTLENYFEPADESTFWPKRNYHERVEKRYFKLPGKIGKIYAEVVAAYNNNLKLLCAAGMRSVIEAVCEESRIYGPTLEQRIDAMKAVLPSNLVSTLHSFRFIGNRALHELEPPDDHDLRMALDVIEDLLNYLFEMDYKASQLLERIKQVEVEKGKKTNDKIV